ncbi:hypothetical protein FOZ60_006066 [Perkinsus olseni]|uniref:Uncharacterized protein n=1 Tax=Perkinsus olseni TaxID=32597 RepID=A0A7J6NQG5_PEROL|nr:hypothetical protein FOZ60_006066 [Perkinsus olseni]
MAFVDSDFEDMPEVEEVLERARPLEQNPHPSYTGGIRKLRLLRLLRLFLGMKSKKMVELEYLRGKKGAKIEGPSQEIRSKFSEFIPFAHVADRIIQGFESGMNDTQCSWLNDHIETHPAGYEKFGRNWLRMFVKEKFVKKAVKKLRKHGEAVLRDEEG